VEQAKRRVSPNAAVAPPGAGEVPPGAERIGAYLARQRELRGISLDELASATRIPVRSLQRLEAGAFDVEPDGFARGFVRTVAIALGLSPDETIARMLPEVRLGDAQRGRQWLVGLAFGFAALALAAGAGASIWWLASRGAPALAPVFRAREDGLVVRRDAVRTLAEEQGLLAARPEPAGSSGPKPAGSSGAKPAGPSSPKPAAESPRTPAATH
jgi:transcriptional regulator with XRE-family HTH domain